MPFGIIELNLQCCLNLVLNCRFNIIFDFCIHEVLGHMSMFTFTATREILILLDVEALRKGKLFVKPTLCILFVL